jgi:hypothetical protein
VPPSPWFLGKEEAVATTWDIMTYTLTGTLGLGILIGAETEHQELTEGWNPPVLLDQRESVPPQVNEWLSPAKLQQMIAPAPESPDLPPPDRPGRDKGDR